MSAALFPVRAKRVLQWPELGSAGGGEAAKSRWLACDDPDGTS